MEVITCAHVHVQGLKQLTCCPFTRSSIKHVDPCTGSLASPLLALSPSSSSTFKSFANSSHRVGDLGTRPLIAGEPRYLNLLPGTQQSRMPYSKVPGIRKDPKVGGPSKKWSGIHQTPRGSRGTLQPPPLVPAGMMHRDPTLGLRLRPISPRGMWLGGVVPIRCVEAGNNSNPMDAMISLWRFPGGCVLPIKIRGEL